MVSEGGSLLFAPVFLEPDDSTLKHSGDFIYDADVCKYFPAVERRPMVLTPAVAVNWSQKYENFCFLLRKTLRLLNRE